MKQNAFTLIELLVVIAIIAILAAILFPVFITAKSKSQQAACMAHMRQIGIASLMYTEENDDAVVGARLVFVLGNDYDAWNPSHHWWGALYPYMKNKNVVTCPGDAYKNTKFADWIDDDQWKNQILPKRSYMMNLNIDPVCYFEKRKTSKAQRHSFLPDQSKWTKASIIRSPTRLILFSEGHWPGIAWGFGNGAWIWWGDIIDPQRVWGPATGPVRTAPNYHNAGGNFIFVDGHVKHLKETNMEMWYSGPKL